MHRRTVGYSTEYQCGNNFDLNAQARSLTLLTTCMIPPLDAKRPSHPVVCRKKLSEPFSYPAILTIYWDHTVVVPFKKKKLAYRGLLLAYRGLLLAYRGLLLAF